MVLAATDLEGAVKLGFRDELAVVLAGPRPEVVLGMTSHVPTLKRTLESVQVSDNPTKTASAIELGRTLIGNHLRGEIIVLTDGCSPELRGAHNDAEAASPATTASTDKQGPVIQYQLFGGSAANVGIVQ